MYVQESDLLRFIINDPGASPELLSARSGHPMRVLERIIERLIEQGMITADRKPTEQALSFAAERTPRNAVILAAGYGMRMVPINHATPKALLEVDGETLIERLIKQLHEAGIHDITVITGYKKEEFRFLIPEYGVNIIENDEYSSRNNLHSLALAAERIGNTFIMPCDLWCSINPFIGVELYSWYMINDLIDDNSIVRAGHRRELRRSPQNYGGNAMLGISYILDEDAPGLIQRLKEYDADPAHDSDRWEEALFVRNVMIAKAHYVHASEVINVNTYEQLRALDFYSVHLQSSAIEAIADALGVYPYEIRNISIMKKGMTNRSFYFTVNEDRFIMRIPGEGTDELVNRHQETEVYGMIKGLGFCDDPLYIDPDTGYKISLYLEGVRSCDPDSREELTACMRLLKRLHDLGLKVDHTFDIFERIEYYESLWEGFSSVHPDHAETKKNVLALRPYIEAHAAPYCLCHIDANADNFLFYEKEDGTEGLQLTDWEYAGMQDPHLDIAMFCIYSMYNRKQVDRLINIYFGDEKCPEETRIKIYCYIAVCGLMWSDWCEYKSQMGIEFGAYAKRQYRYARDYSRIVARCLKA